MQGRTSCGPQDFQTWTADEKLNEKLSSIELKLINMVTDYKHRGPGFDSRVLLRIFLRELGLERGPLSLVIG
jgi:hypothetical protein